MWYEANIRFASYSLWKIMKKLHWLTILAGLLLLTGCGSPSLQSNAALPLAHDKLTLIYFYTDG
jgi:hypothetical protein